MHAFNIRIFLIYSFLPILVNKVSRLPSGYLKRTLINKVSQSIRFKISDVIRVLKGQRDI